MPPIPLDERIVVIQRPKSLPLRTGSPQTTSQQPQNTSVRSGPPPPPPHPPAQPPKPCTHPFSSSSSSSERRRRSPHSRKTKGERGPAVGGNGDTVSHSRHSDGTVTLGPGHKHTHTIDIKLSLGARGGTRGTIPGKGHGSNLSHSGSVKGSREKKVSLHLDLGQGDRNSGGTLGKDRGAVQQLQNHPQNKNKTSSHHPNQLSVSPGGVLGLVPAQGQHLKFGKERDQDVPLQTTIANHSSQALWDAPCTGNKENSKLGPTHQTSNPHCTARQQCSTNAPHASVLNHRYAALLPFSSQLPPPFHHQLGQPRPSRSRERPPRHGPPSSRSSSRGGGFPSPDRPCTLNLSHPFNCGCWRLVRCGGGGRSAGCHGKSSSSGAGGGGGRGTTSRATGLKTLGGCLSTSSTTNTSSSNSTASDCRVGLLKPLSCVSCSGGGTDFESPAVLRKKLVAGCLPCAPLSSSAPLRALQSCVGGCNQKVIQTGSSSCSYCSSDPIVITYNACHGKGSGAGRDAGGVGRGSHAAGVFLADDDDYSVRTIWPEELARKMTRSKAQQNHKYSGSGPGAGNACESQGQNGGDGTGPVILDCRNLLEFTRSQLTDHAGRRQLQQGKMAVLDFIGSGAGRDTGRESLKRLWAKGEEPRGGEPNGLNGKTTLPCSTSSHSPPLFSSLPSTHTTLTKPKARGRERGPSVSPHSLPSAQSLHLVLNSLNREQDERNGKAYPSDPPLLLPLPSSLPTSPLDEGAMTPDIENAVLSPILPFLFLGNERDAQDLELLLRLNITFVVNVTTHLPLYHLATGLVRYKRLPATDSSKQNLRQYFEEVFEFIEEAHQSGQGVLVHCQAGVSRSATIVIAYLMKHTLMTMMDSYKYVRSRRPVVSPNLNFMGQLLEFERDLNSGVTPRILTPKLSGLETQV
ncbi:hypothetical protein AAFF_G00321110 [Aldrovandia affinis]|uniref:protein-tyrosine-phosphatase n=1 Tax=Aldrovandia affinis TaxID=143900 RepID=A0AAD7R7B2_9TELE|nr:hypothetical protein AAFF_G00321110 [Aldrovandia affinis]